MKNMTYRSTIASCTLAIASLSLAQPCAAAPTVLFDNGAGGASGIDSTQISDALYAGIGVFSADDFVLSDPASAIIVQWTGTYEPLANSPDNVTISIYSDAGGLPANGNPLFEYSIGSNLLSADSGFDLLGRDVFNYEKQIGGLALDAGTTYWLHIRNDVDGWAWGLELDAGNSAWHSAANDWRSNNHRRDFRILSVPEPSLLSFIGLAGCTAVLRRRRR